MFEVENAPAVKREGNKIAPVENASTTHVPSPRQHMKIQSRILVELSGFEMSIKFKKIVNMITKLKELIQAIFNDIFFKK